MKKFEVSVYLYPKIYKIEADTKEEAIDKVLFSLNNMNFEEIEVEEIQKDIHSCNEHFEWEQKCPNCCKKLKEVVECH